jgi:PAS domain S-box-containing protein
MEELLRKILEGTSAETGAEFFNALVKNLAQTMNVAAAWVTEYVFEYRRLQTLSFWIDGAFLEEATYSIQGTPCEIVLSQGRTLHVADQVAGDFPEDLDLQKLGMLSYVGIPFFDVDGNVLGHLAVMDRKPIAETEPAVYIMRIFAARAAAELRRIRAEARLREREEKLARLLDTAPDAIVELDAALRVRLMNGAAQRSLGVDAKAAVERPFSDFLQPRDLAQLQAETRRLTDSRRRNQPIWLPDILAVRRADGTTFPAEVTLSRSAFEDSVSFILILRNINDRLAAEEKIRSLSRETERLRAEIRDLSSFDDIIGTSLPLMRVLKEVDQVAETDAAVLIHGETGTGKELFARAIHDRSLRKDAPLVAVNCAAIPDGLMESEFFGHEKGAFTGATQRREGRFALADRGTIFLDEVAELPLDLQAKLLRVLQEVEIEPVGGSRARKVDVRVIAATNRDLRAECEAGRFREDLYFRLSVFPLELPPLRDRGDDVALLARTFAEKTARRLGRDIQPPTSADITRLKQYSWPGNVRELQNVIERAVITAENERLNLDRALPEAVNPTRPSPTNPGAFSTDAEEQPFRTAAEMQELERENLRRAMEAADWRVSGEKGAARLLGIPPSTLTSRLKALGIQRPTGPSGR